MKHLKKINEWLTPKSPEEQQFDDLLDRGQQLTPEIVKKIQDNTKVYSDSEDKLTFIQNEIKDFATEIEVHGTLKYNGQEYTGYFTIPKDDDRGKNSWQFFNKDGEFEPEPDDFYNVDNLTQQIEATLLD